MILAFGLCLKTRKLRRARFGRCAWQGGTPPGLAATPGARFKVVGSGVPVGAPCNFLLRARRFQAGETSPGRDWEC